MIEQLYSPLTPDEIQATIQSQISSVPRRRSWEILPLLPQQPDGFYYGKVDIEQFELNLASINAKGSPVMEVVGWVMPVREQSEGGSLIKLQHRPGASKLIGWVLVLLFVFGFTALILLNYRETGRLSVLCIVPAFGLCLLIVFSIVYKNCVAKSRSFLLKLLQLQEAP
ncbi:MAG: hypothetical protein H7Z21_09450 [Hymenobacter sp.]|nr:hypothetical protein [Hymenobacter sp.]